MAGLLSSIGLPEFDCAPNAAPAEQLTHALTNFDSAIDRDRTSADSYRGKACALLALDREREAVTAARSAVGLAPADWRNPSMLGRAQGRAAETQEQWEEAASSLQEAERLLAAQAGNDPLWLARLRNELARVYVSMEATSSATAYFQQVVSQPTPAQGHDPLAPAKACAHAGLGEIYFDQGAFTNARLHFDAARILTDPRVTEHDTVSHACDRLVRATVLYYLSRIATEQPPDNDAAQAIEYADEAFELEGSWRHREQACLSRIRFNRVSSAYQPAGYCTTAGQASPDAAAYVLEGMYHLRTAHNARGDNRNRAWEAAHRAFTNGLRALSEPIDRELKAQLMLGQATALYCVGFSTQGHELEASIARETSQDAYRRAHWRFNHHRVMTCDGSVRPDL